jgi:hypothetical protein
LILLDDEMEAMFIFELVNFSWVNWADVPLGNRDTIYPNFAVTGFTWAENLNGCTRGFLAALQESPPIVISCSLVIVSYENFC